MHARTNVSAIFSSDQGKSWGGEVMVWESPLIGGYVAAQGFSHAGEEKVGLVFENPKLTHTFEGITCSIAIGTFGL